MVENVLNAEHFYFSNTYDLTHTMQRLYNTSPDFISMPLHERVRKAGLLGMTFKHLSICLFYIKAIVLSGEREVTGSIPGLDIPKSLKTILAAPHLALRLTG